MDTNDSLEIRDELSFDIQPVTVEVLDEVEQDWARIEEAVRWCPLHHMLDCSPRRNACSLIDQQRAALIRRKAAADEGA